MKTLLTTLEFSQLSLETPPSTYFPELMDLDVELPLPETTEKVNNYFFKSPTIICGQIRPAQAHITPTKTK